MQNTNLDTGQSWGHRSMIPIEPSESSHSSLTRVAAALGIALQLAGAGQVYAQQNSGVTAPGVSSTTYERPNDSVGGVTQAVSSNIAMQCGAGLVLSGGSCVPMPVPTPPPNCAYGQVYSGGSCVPVSNFTPPTTSCPTGTTLSGGACVPFVQPPPPPPAGCTSKTVSWGAACSGTASATTHGSSRAVSSVTSYTGSATFVCNDGAFLYSSGTCTAPAPVVPPPPPPPSPTPTPTPTPTPPPSCSARSTTISWGAGCSAAVSVGASPSGTSVTVTNTKTNFTGTIPYTCSSGVWGQGSGTCSPVPAPAPPPACAGKAITWSANGSTCSANLPSTPSGSTATVYPSNMIQSGSSTWQCSSGTWSLKTNGGCVTDGA